ncbi:hypothetical protein E3T24_05825 [Cryobacterium sp. TmT2-59]|uniref:Uncharacterized protein n=1 Tax=Cryobacterium shii TaxID=1259235 RepID=A0AAQ2C6K5_9MICO|nr:hypothetical protein E3O49_08435 [Cryobacterium shii]TFC86899.1 hypothetical protein E3T24_05825 [Cryobacterium sp. TmT2-59]TFD18540.1 hypothetical protein E3T32_12015 [Cryobacterium sp. TMT2-23]
MLALLVVLLLELLQRPPDEVPPLTPDAPTEPTDLTETAEIPAEGVTVGAGPVGSEAVGSGPPPPSRDDVD